jgi:hypothetical protein
MFKPLRDYPRLALQWLNPWLRKPALLALFELASKPFEAIYHSFRAYMSKVWVRANITAQVFALEYYLNQEFVGDSTVNSMYVADGDTADVDFVLFMEYKNYNEKGGETLRKVQNFLDTYKLAGYRYRVQPYYKELTGPWSRKFGKKFFWKF